MENTKTELLRLLSRQDLLRATLLVSKIQNAAFDVEVNAEGILEFSAQLWTRTRNIVCDPIAQVQEINQIIFKEIGMQGKGEKVKNIIDDPHRYYLHSVFEKRSGSPLTITLLYSIFCQQIGLAHEIIALPSYYLIKIMDPTGEVYIDPYDYGSLMNTEDFHKKLRVSFQKARILTSNLYEKISPEQLLARLVQQLKHVYILKGSALEALFAVEILTSMYPESPELTRDRGILYCEIEYFSKAIDDLRFYLKHRPNGEDVTEIKKLTSMLKGYREIVN